MEKTIFMSELGVVKAPDRLRTTLGSCIGIVLLDTRSDSVGLAHIMLPSSEGHSNDAELHGKFANTAVPALLNMMNVPLVEARTRVVAKIAGGANMFAKIVHHDLILIGEQNIKAVKRVLGEMGIRVMAEHLGGAKGRQLIVDAAQKKVFVSCLGEAQTEL